MRKIYSAVVAECRNHCGPVWMLDEASTVEQLNIPGMYLHPLKGDRKGEWAMTVSGNWRITFRFEGDDVTIVNLEDYH